MTTSYPTSLDNFTNPTASDNLNTPTVLHSDQHSNLNDAVEALQAKVGIDNSGATTSLDYRVNALEDATEVQTIVAGSNISVDSTDPANPIVSANDIAAVWGNITGTLSNQTDLKTALDAKLSTTLADTKVFVGNGSNVATAVSMSGDAAIANTGAVTLATVNASVGSFGSNTESPIIVLDAKGRATAATQITITPAATSITGGAALTKVDDTNVTLTLGGSSTNALLKATSITVGWSGQLALARGGLNANLTASNGGIFYSTSTAGAILAGTATARQMLQSGSSAAPAWSTSTWPATTTVNRILYSSATNTVGEITTVNNSVVATNGSGVPACTTTLPNAVQDNITRLGSVTSCTALSVQSGSIDTTGAVIQCAASNAGGNQRIAVTNSETANTSSHAKLQANTNNSGSGDPIVEWSITSQTTFTAGLDNSDSDSFKEQFSATIGSSTTRVVTTAGEQTMPLQPAFLAYLASNVNNVTGNGATFTLGNTTALTEVFDQNGDFNPTGGTFTAPVTAKQPFQGAMIATGCTAASYADIRLVTSNRSYVFQQFQRLASADNYGLCGSVLADMDAGDTANLQILVTGEAGNTVDVQGGSLLVSYFSGGILC
jgi:hypothetical protein